MIKGTADSLDNTHRRIDNTPIGIGNIPCRANPVSKPRARRGQRLLSMGWMGSKGGGAALVLVQRLGLWNDDRA